MNQDNSLPKALRNVDINNPCNDDFNQFGGLNNRRRSSILKLNDLDFERRSLRRVSWAQTFQYKELLSDGTTVVTSQELDKYGPDLPKENVVASEVKEIQEPLDCPKEKKENETGINDANIMKIKKKFGQQHLPQVLSKYYNPNGNLKDFETIINTALNKYEIEVDVNLENFEKILGSFKNDNPSQEQNLVTFLEHFNLNNAPITAESQTSEKNCCYTKMKSRLNYTIMGSDEMETTGPICFNSTKISDDHNSLNFSMIDQSPIKIPDVTGLITPTNNQTNHQTVLMSVSIEKQNSIEPKRTDSEIETKLIECTKAEVIKQLNEDESEIDFSINISSDSSQSVTLEASIRTESMDLTKIADEDHPEEGTSEIDRENHQEESIRNDPCDFLEELENQFGHLGSSDHVDDEKITEFQTDTDINMQIEIDMNTESENDTDMEIENDDDDSKSKIECKKIEQTESNVDFFKSEMMISNDGSDAQFRSDQTEYDPLDFLCQLQNPDSGSPLSVSTRTSKLLNENDQTTNDERNSESLMNKVEKSQIDSCVDQNDFEIFDSVGENLEEAQNQNTQTVTTIAKSFNLTISDGFTIHSESDQNLQISPIKSINDTTKFDLEKLADSLLADQTKSVAELDLKPRQGLETSKSINDSDENDSTLSFSQKLQTETSEMLFTTDLNFSHAIENGVKVDVFEISSHLNTSNRSDYSPTRPIFGKNVDESSIKCESNGDDKMENFNEENGIQFERKDSAEKIENNDGEKSAISSNSLQRLPETADHSVHDDDSNESCRSVSIKRPINETPTKQKLSPAPKIIKSSEKEQIQKEQPKISGSMLAQINSELSTLKPTIPQQSAPNIGSFMPIFAPYGKLQMINVSSHNNLDNLADTKSLHPRQSIVPKSSFRVSLAPAKQKIEILEDTDNFECSKIEEKQTDSSLTSLFRSDSTKNHVRKSLGLTLRDKLLEKIIDMQQNDKILSKPEDETGEEEVDEQKYENENSIESSYRDVTMGSIENDACDDNIDQQERILSPIEMEKSVLKMLSIDNYEKPEELEQTPNESKEISQKFDETNLSVCETFVTTMDMTANFSMWLDECVRNDDSIKNLNYSVCAMLTEPFNDLKLVPELAMFDFLKKMDFPNLHVRVQSINVNLLVLRYLFSTLELRIHFGSIVKPKFNRTENSIETREIVAIDLVSLIDSKKPLPEDIMKARKDPPLYDGDWFLLTFREEHRPILNLAHDYVLTRFEERRNFFDKTFKDTSKLEEMIKEFSLFVTPAKMMATELRTLLSKEIAHILPKNQLNDRRFGISVEILGVRLNTVIHLHISFGHLKYPDEVIHPIIIIPEKEKHLYPLVEFSEALKMIKPSSYNYITNLIHGARCFIRALAVVMKQNKLHQKQLEEIRSFARFELPRS
ncbi:hypothetical protein SSS_06787 [Sarcoptes scabiei]|uniref:Uncharacterized protein n=1 Tax=Sarcoptes scabiei TaxID=52283 RepID=A0A834RES0_SARSC|nr:hypothetical protein SSS_06787 [Sarcoptes scabiei]